MDIQVEDAVRILEVVVREVNVGAIRGAEEHGNECVAVILIYSLLSVALLRFAAEIPRSVKSPSRAVVILSYGKFKRKALPHYHRDDVEKKELNKEGFPAS